MAKTIKCVGPMKAKKTKALAVRGRPASKGVTFGRKATAVIYENGGKTVDRIEQKAVVSREGAKLTQVTSRTTYRKHGNIKEKVKYEVEREETISPEQVASRLHNSSGRSTAAVMPLLTYN